MTTVTRSNSQNRSSFMLPAYTLAFILPVIAISFAYLGMDTYCNLKANEMVSPRVCIGLHQFQGNALELPALQH